VRTKAGRPLTREKAYRRIYTEDGLCVPVDANGCL
jgi:hypothetical protein